MTLTAVVAGSTDSTLTPMPATTKAPKVHERCRTLFGRNGRDSSLTDSCWRIEKSPRQQIVPKKAKRAQRARVQKRLGVWGVRWGGDELSAHSSNCPNQTNARACKGQGVDWRWICQHPQSKREGGSSRAAEPPWCVGWAEMPCRSGAKAAERRSETLSWQSKIWKSGAAKHGGSCLEAHLFTFVVRNCTLRGRIGQPDTCSMLIGQAKRGRALVSTQRDSVAACGLSRASSGCIEC